MVATAVSQSRTTVKLFRLNLEYSPTLGCACQLTQVSSKLCETSKAVSSFSVILGVCGCFLVFLGTPWTDSIEDICAWCRGRRKWRDGRYTFTHHILI